jgi:hypothetical protein
MWSNPQENEDSAGFSDSLLDSVFAIAGAVIIALLAAIAWRIVQ